MNKQIQRIAMVVVVMVVVLLVNSTYVQVFKADALRSDSRNTRVLLDEYSRQRGLITAGSTVIANSVPTNDRFKFLRVYPNRGAEAFAPVTGYFSYQFASERVEKYEDPILNGSDDRLFGQRFLDLFSGRDPRGGNVVTTINPKLQQVAYNALRNGCDGGCRGSVVAIEPTTGRILTLASAPSYDPNLLASHDQNVREDAWTRWNNPNSVRQPMLNRAIDQRYPPGSTFKVITTAAALRDGVNTNIRLTAAPSMKLPDSPEPLTNYAGETCPGSSGGTVSLTQAFQYSCNTAFGDLSVNKMKGATSALIDMATRFGLNQSQPGIPIPVRATSETGDIPGPATLAQASIGQASVVMSPLQNAMIAATIANGGVRMQPYLVDKLQAPDLRTLLTTQPTTINEPITSTEAATLTQLMIASEQHTAGSGGPIPIASKTGTAEHCEAASCSGETPYSWYIAFGPSSNAKIAVAVIVENGQLGSASTGGAIAAPIGRAVINALVGGGNG
ncbi:penicillin-binding protein PbpA [Gordonia effusa NBRC 100432]|uniref:Penicillin-binding protein PbpA n=1 Tax=Gordonia effusa NBRC 100432 TaxID=1077974 RepID=H0QWV6_9ACTN|nr:penicillin-binding protein 2 [Gordonia effusa]GAB17307.1 penicillin-binding protein PbpA [Gordonia effusa NBRC 100432]